MLNESRIVSRIEPDEMNGNNTNHTVSYRQHLYSVLHQLMHTGVGGIGDDRVLFFEDALTYIEDEDGSGELMVEQ